MDINISLINEVCKPKSDGTIFANLEEDEVIPPKGSTLIPLGFSMKIDEDYDIIFNLTEHMIDNDIMYVGFTIAPDGLFNELGIVIINYGKKSFRVEDGDTIGKFSFIKKEKINFIVDQEY